MQGFLVVAALAALAAGQTVVSTNYVVGKHTTHPPPATTAGVAAAPGHKTASTVTSLSSIPRGPQAFKHPEQWPVLPYPNNDEHAWVGQMKALQSQIEDHEHSLTDLGRELKEAQEHRAKLKHAQHLLHSMVALHQSEHVLGQLDNNIETLKQTIKKLGQEAEDAMHGRDSMKDQLEDSMKEKEEELKKLRALLMKHKATMSALDSKRTQVASTVSEWRDFVDQLRTANGLFGGASVPLLPRPPAEGEEEAEDAAEESKADPQAVRKTPMETISAKTGPPSDLSLVTAEPHEIQATHDSIQDLLQVHLPRISKGAALLQVKTSLRHNRRN